MQETILIRESQDDEGRIVVGVAGWLVAGPAVETLRRRVEGALRRGARELIIDLSRARVIDCGGLGALLACWGAARRAGASFQVLRSRGAVRRMLALSALLQPLERDAFHPRVSRGDVPLLLHA